MRREIWSLMKTAPMAHEAPIELVVRAAVLFGDDVIDMERDEC